MHEHQHNHHGDNKKKTAPDDHEHEHRHSASCKHGHDGQDGHDHGAHALTHAQEQDNESTHDHAEHQIHTCGHGHHHEHNQTCGHDHNHEEHGNSHHNQEPVKKTGMLSRFFNTKAGKALSKIKKPAIIASSLGLATSGLAASTGLIPPDFALPSAAALGLGLYFMHKTSDYALEDIGKFGQSAGLGAMTLGVLSGLVHSASEAFVSLQAVAGGNTDLALSNIMGGSIIHTLGILGAAAAIAGIGDKKGGTLGWRFNTLVMAGGAGAFAGQLTTGQLWPGLSAAMLGYGGYYLYQRVKGGEDCAHDHGDGASCSHGHHHGHDHDHEHEHEHTHSHNHAGHTDQTTFDKAMDAGKATLALGALIGISHYVVKNALELSDATNLNHTFMGVVVVAAGTALSEAYLTIRSAMKKNTQFALGNVLGCNITNTLLVGGAIGAVSGLESMMDLARNIVPDQYNLNTLEGKMAWGTLIGASAGLTALLARTKNNISPKNLTNTFLVGGGITAICSLDSLGFQLPEHLKTITVPDSLNLNSVEGMINWGTFAASAAGITALMAAQNGHITRKQGGLMLAGYMSYVAATYNFSEPLFNCHSEIENGEVVQHCLKPGEDYTKDILPQYMIDPENDAPIISFD